MKVRFAVAQSLLDDLTARPGFAKLDKEAGALPRMALHRVLDRLLQDMATRPILPHLRADVLTEPPHILDSYHPASLRALLLGCERVVPVSKASAFWHSQPYGHVASFHFPRIGWSVVASYAEVQGLPVLVMQRAMPQGVAEEALEALAADPAEFDVFFGAGLAVARQAT